MVDHERKRLLEAYLFANAQPVTNEAIARVIGRGEDIPSLLASLQQDYRDRGVHLECSGGRWAFRTAADLAQALRVPIKAPRSMSKAMVETLSVIAYHQPATRADIESVRGVTCDQAILGRLLEKGWIRPQGRKPTPGRPVLWATTPAFLDHFGLSSRDDLPGLRELRAMGFGDSGTEQRRLFDEMDPAALRNEDAGGGASNPDEQLDFDHAGENTLMDEDENNGSI